MAQKRKQAQKKMRIEDCSLKMQAHIGQLGISSLETYKEWCRAHNFSQGLDKNPRQRRDELYVSTRMQATQIMAKEKRDRNLSEILPKIYSQELRLEKLQNAVTRAIAETFHGSIAPKVLLKLLLYLENNSDLLQETTYIRGIAALADHHESWLRSAEEWSVKKHNRDRQFSELARHLLAAYDVPLFTRIAASLSKEGLSEKLNRRSPTSLCEAEPLKRCSVTLKNGTINLVEKREAGNLSGPVHESVNFTF